MEKKEEGNSEMGEDNCVSVNRRTGLYYSRRRKRKRLTNIECLPDDLLFNILLYLPAQDIYDNARLVCWKWYHIINTRNFKCAHFDHTTCGLLIQDKYYCQRLFFVGMRQGRIEISKFNWGFGKLVWGSCNGLILEYEEIDNKDTLYIVNPVTKQQLPLPPFCQGQMIYLASYGVAYVAASMVYKVVVTYASRNSNLGIVGCSILTVGVDSSWRDVNIQHLSQTAKRQLLRFHSTIRFTAPIITEGFMHWSRDYTHFLTMNVESEIITETLSPQVYGGPTEQYCFSTGRYLSLLIACGKLLWEVWEMKPETGEWTSLPNIDLEAQKFTLDRFDYKRKSKRHRNLEPVGWLKYKEVLVLGSFDALRTFIAYDVRREEIDSFQLISGRRLCFFNNVHRNSLVWLDG